MFDNGQREDLVSVLLSRAGTERRPVPLKLLRGKPRPQHGGCDNTSRNIIENLERKNKINILNFFNLKK